MTQLEWRRGVRRASVTALLVGALGALGACGQDLPLLTGQGPTYSPNSTTGIPYDCCVSGIYYTCATKLAYGMCFGTPPDVSQCTLQTGRDCPPAANQ